MFYIVISLVCLIVLKILISIAKYHYLKRTYNLLTEQMWILSNCSKEIQAIIGRVPSRKDLEPFVQKIKRIPREKLELCYQYSCRNPKEALEFIESRYSYDLVS